MIPYANWYQYVNCPIRPKGTELSDYSPRLNMSLEEWLWIEEAIRTAEIRASVQVSYNRAEYKLSYPKKVDAARIIPDRATFDDWLARLNAIRAKSYITGVTWGNHIGPSRFRAFGSGTVPVETAAQLEQFLTRGVVGSQIPAFPESMALTPSMVRTIERYAESLTTIDLVRDAQAFQVSSLRNVVTSGRFNWHRNGAASSSPESERLSGVFQGAPFLQYNSTTGAEKHLAQAYFRVKYDDQDIGSVDYTYTLDGEYMMFGIPGRPWYFDRNGQDTTSECDVFIRIVFNVYHNSIWKIKLSGSSVWDVMYGEFGDYVAFSPGYLIHGIYSRDYLDVPSLSSACRDIINRLRLETIDPSNPRVNGGTIAEKRRIGDQWYVEPGWAIVEFRPNPRVLN